MNFPEFSVDTKFVDPFEGGKPNIEWFNNLMQSLALGQVDKISTVRQKILTIQEEYSIFRIYNWSRYQMRLLQDKWIEQERPELSSQEIQSLLNLNAEVTEYEKIIVSFNLGLIVAMAKKIRGHMTSEGLSDYISDGGLAMVRSTRKFDATRGYKFSTYFCRCAIKQMWRGVQGRIKASKKEKNITSLGGKNNSDDWNNVMTDKVFVLPDTMSSDLITQDRLQILHNILSNTLSIVVPEKLKLTEVEKMAVTARFSLNAKGKLTILSDIGKDLQELTGKNFCKERVRQVLDEAFRKMRLIISAHEIPVDEQRDFVKAQSDLIRPTRKGLIYIPNAINKSIAKVA